MNATLRFGLICLLIAATLCGCGSKDDIPVVKGPADASKSAGTFNPSQHDASQMQK